MDFRSFYKINPRVICKKQEKRVSAVESRKSRRLENFNEHRKNIEVLKEETYREENEKPNNDVKKTRQTLLQRWKALKLTDKSKKEKKPFVVGIVRHAVGSPHLFRDISNNVIAKAVKKLPTKVTKTLSKFAKPAKKHVEVPSNSDVFSFGKQKAVTQFKFKINPSDKKLTVPVSPAVLNPGKRGNLKPEKNKQKMEAEPVKSKTTMALPHPSAQKDARQTRGVTKGKPVEPALKNMTTKPPSTTVKQEIPTASTSKTVKVPQLHRTPVPEQEIKKAINNFVFSPPVSIHQKNEIPTSTSRKRQPRGHELLLREAEQIMNTTPMAGQQMSARMSSRQTRSVTRGSLRKCNEQAERKSVELTNPIDQTNVGPVQEYYDRLKRETEFLLQRSDDWAEIAVGGKLPRDVHDEIDSTVGQARLLVRDKFEQFRRLVVRFEQSGEPPVTTDDLEGFWDMMYIQVAKMKERFESLSLQQSNNWLDTKAKKAPAHKSVKPAASKKVVAKSKFREFMKRNKAEIELPSVSPPKMMKTDQLVGTPTKTPIKDKLLHNVLNSGQSKRRRSSVASACCAMRSSLIGKTIASPLVDAEDRTEKQSEHKQSILKKGRSSMRLTNRIEKDEEKKVGFGSTVEITDLNQTFEIETP